MNKLAPKTLGELKQERIPGYDLISKERERTVKLENEGCLIRSLSSILGTPLTREQEDFRLSQTGNSHDILEQAFQIREQGEEPNIKKIIEDAVEINKIESTVFITMVASQIDTAAGKAMCNYNWRFSIANFDEIKELCKRNIKVLILNPLHAAHVGVSQDGNTLISLSDSFTELNIPNKKATYDVVQFETK